MPCHLPAAALLALLPCPAVANSAWFASRFLRRWRRCGCCRAAWEWRCKLRGRWVAAGCTGLGPTLQAASSCCTFHRMPAEAALLGRCMSRARRCCGGSRRACLPQPAIFCMHLSQSLVPLAPPSPALDRLSRFGRTLWCARCRWAACSTEAWPLTRCSQVGPVGAGRLDELQHVRVAWGSAACAPAYLATSARLCGSHWAAASCACR